MERTYGAFTALHNSWKGVIIQMDCTVKINDGYINIRVGAIILKDNNILMVKKNCHDYLYSVGGRVKFGETAKEAIIREVFEETGHLLEIDRLGFIHENLFFGDDDIQKGKLIYEITYFFYMQIPENFDIQSFSSINDYEKLVWIDIDSDLKYYPEFFRQELKRPEYHIKYIVSDDRKRIV